MEEAPILSEADELLLDKVWAEVLADTRSPKEPQDTSAKKESARAHP